MSEYLYKDEQDKTRIKQFARTDLNSIMDLYGHTTGFKKYFSIYFVVILLSTLFLMVADRVTGLMLDNGFLARNYTYAAKAAATTIITVTLGILIEWRAAIFLHKYSSLVILAIRKRIFNKLLNLSRSYYDHTPSGRIVTRMTHDVENIERFFSKSLSIFFIGAFHLIISTTYMLFLHTKLGLIIIVSVLPGIIFLITVRGLLRDVFRRISRVSSAMNAKLSEYIDGMEIIRSYGLEEWTKDSYDDLNNDYLAATLKSNTLFALVRPVISFLMSAPMLILLYFGGKYVLAGEITIGLFVTFSGLVMKFIRPCMTISNELQELQEAFTNSERIMALLNEKEEDDLFISSGDKKPDLRGDIVFHNLHFRYEENDDDVLKNINLTISQGERIGIIGRTGSGKTSLTSLLMRLYEYRNGDILINGISLHQIDRHYLRLNIGYVSQQVYLFPDTVRNNIVLGRDIDEDFFKLLCERCGLNTLMKNNHWDLETRVLQSGGNFALGEKHLICILRELVIKPPILILDEATASLDFSFEDVIYQTLAELARETTIIIVAHRPETFNKCDRIIKISAGKIK